MLWHGMLGLGKWFCLSALATTLYPIRPFWIASLEVCACMHTFLFLYRFPSYHPMYSTFQIVGSTCWENLFIVLQLKTRDEITTFLELALQKWNLEKKNTSSSLPTYWRAWYRRFSLSICHWINLSILCIAPHLNLICWLLPVIWELQKSGWYQNSVFPSCSNIHSSGAISSAI